MGAKALLSFRRGANLRDILYVGVFLHLILITIWVHTHVAAKTVKPIPLLSGAKRLSVLCPGPHITLTAELHACLDAWCTWPHAAFVTSST